MRLSRGQPQKVGNKNICHYSKYVKVGYYGGTTETKKNSKF